MRTKGGPDMLLTQTNRAIRRAINLAILCAILCATFRNTGSMRRSPSPDLGFAPRVIISLAG